MHNILAIDAGGTSTRAVVLSPRGDCLGYGVSGVGNPVSSGFEAAIASLVEAGGMAQQGLAAAPPALASATLAVAGVSLQISPHLFRERLAPLGLTGQLVIESDMLAAFYSGTFHDDGYALIAGTGAVAARVRAGKLDAVADGTGWLLGDNGSGFWLGREAVRAVAAALDGRGEPTVLTALILADLDISLEPEERLDGRVAAQQQLIAKVYQLRPIELSRFAPLVFAAQDDPVAASIIEGAADALAMTLAGVTDPRTPGPIIFGGSVLTKGGAVAQAVRARLAAHLEAAGVEPWEADGGRVTLVDDGVVGAAVMALKHDGITVDAEIFQRIKDSLAVLRG